MLHRNYVIVRFAEEGRHYTQRYTMKAFPHERAIPFIKLDILKLVALCSGRLTSVIRASQLGILADWTADANIERRKHSVFIITNNKTY